MIRSLMKSPWAFFLTVATLLGVQACGGTIYLVKSQAPKGQIVIDGKVDDWAGNLGYDEKDHLSVGFLNDQTNVYVALVLGKGEASGYRLGGGLTVWIDPTGGEKKTLGIRYPLHSPRPGQSRRRAPDEAAPAKENEPINTGPQLEVIRVGTPETMTLEQAKEKGLEVRESYSEESFAYELKIPLQASGSESLGIGVNQGRTIGIGFETEKPEFGENRERRQGDKGGGGGRPHGGMGGGLSGGGMRGRGGMRGGGRGEPGMGNSGPKSLKSWFEVQLHSGAGPGSARSHLAAQPSGHEITK